ncbi:hypothetical protein IIY68_01800 [Candidatus Saccharibacteria bacterium]|nr:hypothetical protein [Candidatus Saccharibacteria bacterium]
MPQDDNLHSGRTLFSTDLLLELEGILNEKYRDKYLPSDLQEIGLSIAKFVFMKEVLYGKV